MTATTRAVRPHLVLHLGVQVLSMTGETTTARALVRADHLVGGQALAGHLATLVDVTGGVCAARRADGAVVTSSLDVHLPAAVGAGEIHAEARVLRAGRRSVVTEVVLTGHDGAPCGVGTVASTVLPLREDQRARVRRFADAGDDQDRAWWSRPPDETYAHVPLLAHLGIRQDRDASVLDLREDLTNGHGVLHGGAGALLIGQAAAHALQPAGRVSDLTVHYLAPARTGPFRARARVAASGDTAHAVRVDVLDDGQDGRPVLAGVASVTV